MKYFYIFIILIASSNLVLSQTSNCAYSGTPITVGSSCTYQAFNSTNNSDYWNSANSCGAADWDDAWWWFTATSTTTNISYYSGNDAVLHVFTGACATNMTYLACSDNYGSGGTESIVLTTNVGQNYAVRIQRYATNTSMYGSICVWSPAVCTQNSVTLTMNDSWGDGWNGGEITLTNDSGGSYGPYSIGGASGSQALCLPDGCYSINQVAGSYPGEITWSLSNGVSGNGYYGSQSNVFTLGSGSCGAVTGCTDPAAVNYNPLATLSDGSCVYPPSNDNPCSAISLPVNLSCSYLTYTNANATATSGPPAPGCANYVGSDVWFTVTVPSSGLVNLDMQTGVMTDAGMAVYSGTCGSLTLIECDDDDSPNGFMSAINLTGQTPGSTLWIRVWEYGADNNGTFGICASSPLTYQDTWVSMNTGSSNWCVGETRTVSVTVTNSGSATWTNATPDVNIGVKWNADADYFVRVDANGLAPGATQTYNLSVTAPSTGGTNNLTFDIVNEANFWFSNNTNGGGPGNVVYTSPLITINDYPTVNAGADQTSCVATAVNLSGAASVGGSGSQTFTWTGQGYDNAYYYVGGSTSGIPAGATITGITVNGSIVSGSGTSYCPTWYSFDVWLNGAFQTYGCNGNYNLTALNGQPANGQLIQISSYDDDAIGDYCYMTLVATVSYTVSATPSISWSPGTNLTSTTILNPVASPSNSTVYTLSADNNGCIATDQVLVTVNNPTLVTAPTNGDMVWKGAATTDWATLGNWWLYNGTSYVAATAAPTDLQNVIIPSAGTTCVLSQPNTFANAGSAKSLRIESGATLTMGNGTLTVAENWVNNGTFTPGSGTVAFTGTGNHSISGSSATHAFNNLTMNKNGEIILSVPIIIAGSLTLTDGRLNIVNFNLDLPTNTINGGNVSSYVKTSGTGTLNRNVAAIPVSFPVGRSAYNAATLTNSGTADKYSIRVIDNVTDIGTNADAGPTTTSMAVVNRTWMINEQVAGGSNVTLGLNWNGAPEHLNGFQPTNAFIAHYMSSAGLWDNIGGAVATNTIETTGITSFSPFTISSDFSPLPVELMSFSSSCLDNDVAIKWSTASENNSMHFEVESSVDAFNWKVIAVVDAAQFSTSLIDYAILHEGAAREKNYYRLKQVDTDGAYEYYSIIYSDCGSDLDGAPIIFPNPSKNNFTIDFGGSGMKGIVQLTLVSMEGKEISNRQLNLGEGVSTFQINNLELQPGLYLIKMTDVTGKLFIIKHRFN